MLLRRRDTQTPKPMNPLDEQMTKRQRIKKRIVRDAMHLSLTSRDEIERLVESKRCSDPGVNGYCMSISRHSQKMLIAEVAKQVARKRRHEQHGTPAEQILQKFDASR